MVKAVVTLRAAIIDAVKVLMNDEFDTAGRELTISLEPSGDDLVLSFGDSNLPGVPLRESLTETLVSLAEDTADRLEGAAEDKRTEFKELFHEEMAEIRDMAEADDVSEWEGILDDIIKSAQALKRRMDTDLIEEAESLESAAEDLRSAIQEFEDAQKPVTLVS